MRGSCHCRIQKRELSSGVLLRGSARQRAARGRPGRSTGAALPPRPKAAAPGPAPRTGEHLAPQSASAPSQRPPQPQRVDSGAPEALSPFPLSFLVESDALRPGVPTFLSPASLPGLPISLPVLTHPSGRQPFL